MCARLPYNKRNCWLDFDTRGRLHATKASVSTEALERIVGDVALVMSLLDCILDLIGVECSFRMNSGIMESIDSNRRQK